MHGGDVVRVQLAINTGVANLAGDANLILLCLAVSAGVPNLRLKPELDRVILLDTMKEIL